MNLAENWNDVFFTDLEAEIEAEGYYFASWFDRLRRRRSSGLRRARSLIQALEFSAERTLLVVGEPGSGKSVAFRHLALQLAARGARSSARRVPVPLYVNLKELPPAPPGGPDADFIHRFVLDNIRHGDAETAEFVREHWDEYRTRGVWFFLFDSFDEIPAILHAPTGSGTIRAHAEAIRNFLDAMGECRGCLASREYKGPDRLPWQKFRVLPLSPRRQDELICNAVLSADGLRVVRRYLATRPAAYLATPLFLTMLCQHVRRTGVPPGHDHNLLDERLAALAARDTEYTTRTFQLSPDELLAGATQLAVLFAEQLSLFPTVGEIRAAWPAGDPLAPHLDNLLGALVYVKIGRSDVAQAKQGDRKFTFAHRRYQETLFVRFLSAHPEHVPPGALLTDPRWREYTVTLLQTQPPGVIGPLLAEAAARLRDAAKAQVPVPVRAEYGDLGYYTWDPADPPQHLLRALQEGLCDRTADVTAELADAAEAFLGPRWDGGDWYDRQMVLEMGAVLPQPVLGARLLVAVREGGARVQRAAFKQVATLRELPADLADWVRERVGEEVLAARTPAELLQTDALCARLQGSLGARVVFDRATALRAVRWPGRALRAALERLGAAETNIRRFVQGPIEALAFGGIIDLYYLIMLFGTGAAVAFLGGVGLVRYQAGPPGADAIWPAMAALAGAALFLYATQCAILGLCLSIGHCISASDVCARSWDLVRRAASGEHARRMLVAFAGLSVILAALMGALVVAGDGALVVVVVVVVVGSLAYGIYDEHKSGVRMRNSIATGGAIPLRAGSFAELQQWLRWEPSDVLPTEADIRSLGRLLTVPAASLPDAVRDAPLVRGGLFDSAAAVARVANALTGETVRRAAAPAPEEPGDK